MLYQMVDVLNSSLIHNLKEMQILVLVKIYSKRNYHRATHSTAFKGITVKMLELVVLCMVEFLTQPV